MDNILIKEKIFRQTPSTRYQGSKRRILPWIYDNIKHLRFKTVLDGFGGTGSVSYLFKLMGKQVTFNDILKSNYQTGLAFIENNSVKLTDTDINFIISKNGFKYPSFIQKTFKDVYFLDSENKWLDRVVLNIDKLSEKYKGELLAKKRALAYHSLFQACLCKRPFNLFHRKNLYIRTSDVDRNFGNQKIWNTDFNTLFQRFAEEISNKVIENNQQNKALCKDIMEIDNNRYDLVYLDPPYSKSMNNVPQDYYSLYHFLEGILDYENWSKSINWNTKHKCLVRRASGWEQNSLENNFDYLFKKFHESIIVLSYGEPGYPSIKVVEKLLKKYKIHIKTLRKPYKYKLSKNNNNNLNEVLIIGS